jgi:hypothetical protein
VRGRAGTKSGAWVWRTAVPQNLEMRQRHERRRWMPRRSRLAQALVKACAVSLDKGHPPAPRSCAMPLRRPPPAPLQVCARRGRPLVRLGGPAQRHRAAREARRAVERGGGRSCAARVRAAGRRHLPRCTAPSARCVGSGVERRGLLTAAVMGGVPRAALCATPVGLQPPVLPASKVMSSGGAAAFDSTGLPALSRPGLVFDVLPPGPAGASAYPVTLFTSAPPAELESALCAACDTHTLPRAGLGAPLLALRQLSVHSAAGPLAVAGLDLEVWPGQHLLIAGGWQVGPGY